MSEKREPKKGCCASYGYQIPNGALYCPRCGEPIDPNYVYDESIPPEEAVIKEDENLRVDEIIPTPSPPTVLETGVRVLYEGMMRGSVTGESDTIPSPLVGTSNFFNGSNLYEPLPIPYVGFSGAKFVMRLEEGFEGIPNEVLVQTSKFGYFGLGDKVTLQGRIFRINLRNWNKPMYAIIADHYYNESLQAGDEQSMKKKQTLFRGVIRGSVRRDSKSRIAVHNNPLLGTYVTSGVCFAMKLEENVVGGPDEILVRYDKVGYFGIGDRVILEGGIFGANLRRWGKPSYAIHADRFYNESLQIGDKGPMDYEKILYEGKIRGSVAKESVISPGVKMTLFVERTLFVMKLEEDFEEIPDKILVQTRSFGYFGKGDEVILQGKIFKMPLNRWGRTMYAIIADHYFNESLQFSDMRFVNRKQILYKGIIRGLVTRDSRSRIVNHSTPGMGDYTTTEVYFVMKLEGNIGIAGIPDEILVRSERIGYFGKGDEVVLQGRILKANFRHWERPMYLIIADQYYNESLQIGD
ncbi:MAG: hypothetical protein WED07_13570 [Candidatus Freyarchaeum deiterrae]